jgi:ribosome biogenesis GTPase
LPNGGLLIDTPGIRELQLWGTEENLDENFDDIIELTKHCQYKRCQHKDEVGCAVKAALRAGQLKSAHFANYQKMKRELATLQVKSDARAQMDNKRSYKNIRRQTEIEQREIQDEINYTER